MNRQLARSFIEQARQAFGSIAAFRASGVFTNVHSSGRQTPTALPWAELCRTSSQDAQLAECTHCEPAVHLCRSCHRSCSWAMGPRQACAGGVPPRSALICTSKPMLTLQHLRQLNYRKPCQAGAPESSAGQPCTLAFRAQLQFQLTLAPMPAEQLQNACRLSPYRKLLQMTCPPRRQSRPTRTQLSRRCAH